MLPFEIEDMIVPPARKRVCPGIVNGGRLSPLRMSGAERCQPVRIVAIRIGVHHVIDFLPTSQLRYSFLTLDATCKNLRTRLNQMRRHK